jgi:hypothetical protein
MDKKDLISLHESASPELRTALEKEFGEFFFKDNIDTMEGAEEYLGLKNIDFVMSFIHKNYSESIMAFYKLRVLCDAWNKQDGFVPDFDDKKQEKWYPVFSFVGFNYSSSYVSPSSANAALGSRLCFKSRERSDEFGEKFEELAKIFLRG